MRSHRSALVAAALVSGMAGAAGAALPSFLVLPIIEDVIFPDTPLPQVTSPGWIAVDEGANEIYAASSPNGEIAVIDGRTDLVVQNLRLAPSSVFAVANPTTHRVYVAHSDVGTITILDGVKKQVVSTVALGGVCCFSTQGGLAVDAERNRVYAGATRDGLSVLDEATGEVRGIPVSATFVDVDTKAGLVYAVTGEGEITVIDADEETVLRTISFSGPDFPTHMAVNPRTDRIYLTFFLSPVDNLLILDAKSGAEVARLTLHVQPLVVTMDEKSNRVYVVAHDPPRMWVLHPHTDEVLHTVALSFTGSETNGCSERHYAAANPATNRVYVPCGTTIAVVHDCDSPGRRPPEEPCQLARLAP